ncbi:SMI1/KNR4 family protein [Paenibacillus polygoni]|uniref:SMI1/KNR4 family protein n=1 Tax=Paenibacillus polygoni TaxID=3050112 RepID=A0ABY8WY75_9BACL|nr:SMI1/KNR4 family protein [Paenibacillus polygoni]WIV17264.1 SMI1/KNR4 family protein [Paenibacillus polygoni]
MKQTLIEQLNNWHEEEEYQKIVDLLKTTPDVEQSYEAVSLLARAYNNLGLYKEALHQLENIAEAGKQDPLWHYRVGYSLYHLKRYEEAAQAFHRSDQLETGDQSTEYFLRRSFQKAEKQKREQLRLARKKASLKRGDYIERKLPFSDMNLTDFWDDSEYARTSYQSDPPTDERIESIEKELGYKLPSSYIQLMKQQNGGIPRNTILPTEDSTSWAEDHIAITGIMGIGREKDYSLCGEFGSPFMIEEWGYPDIGVVICDCPSAGHDVVMLDYRACGRDGEPEVVHVDQEDDYEITFLADNFEAFIRGLVSEDEYDTSEEDKQHDVDKVMHGKFSPLLEELCSRVTEVEQMEQKIRSICARIVEEKGHFTFHANELSYVMYDVQFWLYTKSYPNTSRDQYVSAYQNIIAFGGEFGQGGYAPSFVTDWLDQRIKEGRIVQNDGILRLTNSFTEEIMKQLNEA